MDYKAIDNKDILKHYGQKRRSGRYPWGSGDSSYQHSGDFISRVEELTKQGLSEVDRAKALGITTTDLRMQLRVANHERRELEVSRAKALKMDGKSLNEMANIMGYKNDSSIRSLLNEDTSIRKNMAKTTADVLMQEVEKKGMLDVGIGVERQIGVSQNTLKEALFILETKGYNVYGVGIPQTNMPGKQTNTAVLCKPGVEHKEVYTNIGNIGSYTDFKTTDGGLTYDKREYPASIDSSRIHIRYGDKGGIDKDGVIELRRGVKDLDLGNSHYAQVRILVEGSHYLKGMAMYSDDIPKGADLVFNTNKKSGTPVLGSKDNSVLKPIKNDTDNPFGAYIKANGQSHFTDSDGKKQLSVINKIKEEGDWDKMSKNLSSQFLSKQPMQLINSQLDLTFANHKSEFDSICALTNPTVKKKMLLDFATQCDGAVVHLKAAALPRQKTQVILPITALKETEVYATNFNNGEKVALIRYPHGGTFEIPILTVNNKNVKAKDILGKASDAIGIHPKVAERLSGADFDGDQVVVIPVNDKVRIKSTPALKGLQGFNAKVEYGVLKGNPDNVRLMTKSNTGKQMGMISNLITDMTLIGAPESEMVRAVKHSMVVIDAEKHSLDYKKSEKENGILELKQKYQGYTNSDGKQVGGATTLISRKKQTVNVLEKQGSGRIDPATGKITYKESGRTYKEKIKVQDPETGGISYTETGKVLPAMTKVKLVNNTDDVYSLSSGTPQENAYAAYANHMKSLANEARKTYTTTGNLKQNPEAKIKYTNEIDTLDSKLNLALLNAPRERKAQAVANSNIKAKIQSNPDMDKKEIKTISTMAIYDARFNVGASGKGSRIALTDNEWEAIQSGAVSDAKLSQILRYTDPDDVKQRATPKSAAQLNSTKVNRIKEMADRGYTTNDIAKALGVSTSTILKYEKG